MLALGYLRAMRLPYAEWPKSDKDGEEELRLMAEAYGAALVARGCDKEDLRRAVSWYGTHGAGRSFPSAPELAEVAAGIRAKRFMTIGVQVAPGVLSIREVPRDAMATPEVQALPSEHERKAARERLGAGPKARAEAEERRAVAALTEQARHCAAEAQESARGR